MIGEATEYHRQKTDKTHIDIVIIERTRGFVDLRNGVQRMKVIPRTCTIMACYASPWSASSSYGEQEAQWSPR